MRHGVSLLASLEGMSRPAFRVALELTNNSRSGLTVRFLSKKLDMPEEEVEYLLDVNNRLMFIDLTKVKIVAEGSTLIRRMADGLENHGDVPSLFRRVKTLAPHDFRRLEELIGLEEPVTKKQAAEALLEEHYRHPDSVVSYVATRGFSETAREVFDLLWQSKDGVMPVSQLRVAHGGSEYEVEQALWELVQGFALFEMFRFDPEDRLVRAAGILKEIRQYRDDLKRFRKGKVKLKPVKGKVDSIARRGIDFSDTLCKLIAAIAARPARLRGDGELFREDWRRLAEICSEEAEPSLSTCLWVAECLGWLVRVDNALQAGELETLIDKDRLERHRDLFDYLTGLGDGAASRRVLASMLEDLPPGQWFCVTEFIAYVQQAGAREEQPVLKQAGAHWQYVTPGVGGAAQSRLARALEEAFFWLGLVERGEHDGEPCFTVTELGRAFLNKEKDLGPLQEAFPSRQGEFVVQPNFDIVAPTDGMDPLLTVPLDQFAVRMSSGAVTVYNVTKESFTQAMQEGHDAAAFVQFLLHHNKGGALPANVTTTLEDWRGGLKRVKVRTLHVLESDDPLVVADLSHRKRFAKYFGAVDTSKTIVYKGITKAELTKALEKEGFIVD